MIRMLDKDTEPTDDDIIRFIDDKNATSSWVQLQDFLATSYNLHTQEPQFGGQKYGWCIRYRRSGKTLCTLYPEKNGFTILIVYGKKEVEKFTDHKSEFSEQLVSLFQETKQLHDGKWLWIQIYESKLLEDIKKMLAIKRRPRK